MAKLRNLVIAIIFVIGLLCLIGNIYAGRLPPGKDIPIRAFIDNLSDYNDYVIIRYCEYLDLKSLDSKTGIFSKITSEITSIYDGRSYSENKFNNTQCVIFLIDKPKLESIGGISKLKAGAHLDINNTELQNDYYNLAIASGSPAPTQDYYVWANDPSISKILIYSIMEECRGYYKNQIYYYINKVISVYDNNRPYKYKIEHFGLTDFPCGSGAHL